MGLLLCTSRAEQPFYYEKLDKNLWSIQELCYILYRYPIVIPEDFVDARLCQWIEELGMKFFAERLRQLLKAGEEQDKLILRILREGNYYTEREIQDFGTALRRLKEIDSSQFQEMLGDTFFRIGKYGRAVEAYRMSLSRRKSTEVQMKLADALVTVMQFGKASELYEDIYRESSEKTAIQKLYYLEKLSPKISTFQKYINSVPTKDLAEWESSFDLAAHSAEAADTVERLREKYEEDNAGFREEAVELLRRWKREYREKA